MLSGKLSSKIGSDSSRLSWIQKLWFGFLGEESSVSVRQLQQSLQATTVKLVQIHQQADRLQTQHALKMRQLARAYQDLSLHQRQQLPSSLRKHLDRIESEYFSR
jgi:hypothetical protein